MEKINGLFISSFVPRKCGIATYTRDLTEAINLINPGPKAEIFAMVKDNDNIEYGPEVKFKIIQNETESYIKAAKNINNSNADVVILEHEFGLFGGDHGQHILELIKLLEKPLVVTAHTIPDDSIKGYGLILKRIIKYSEKVIVMMARSMGKLIKSYKCPPGKIEIIPHGVPDIIFEPNDKYKKIKGLEDRLIIGNINLLSEVKGLEYTIEALKDIKKVFPDILYLIIGQTHPVVLQTDGEKYRNFLKEKIKQYDLVNNIKFIDEYLSLDDLIGWLKVIDIYITPYLDPQQSASGALAYAVGAGKACISTPYLYAKEVLANDRGVIVPFKNSFAIKEAVMDIFKNPQKKLEMERKTYIFGRHMTWQNVAIYHLNLFNSIINNQKGVSFNHFWRKETAASIKPVSVIGTT
jgi:polysaccharide biosynthesis protein PslF